MSNISEITAASIIRALGGNNGMCRCPAHDDRTPSLSVRESNGRILVKCFAGCSQEAVIGALREKGLWPTASVREPDRRADDAANYESYERQREALAILRAAERANGETPTEYLKGRGIHIVPEAAMLMPGAETRRLAGKQLWPDGPVVRLAHGGYPAMVLAIVSENGLQGAHVTFLSKDCTAKLAAREMQRQMFGAAKGGYVIVSPPDPDKVLVVAEGFETACAASQIAGAPAIASLSAGNFSAITPPPCRELIIAADNDESGTGQQKAEEAARKWTAEGRVVRIAIPKRQNDAKKADWNSALQGEEDIDDLRSALLDAPKFEQDSIEARLEKLAALEPLQYEQQRKAAADDLGWRVSVLDKEVEARRERPDSVSQFLAPVEPWEEPVDGDELLTELRETINRHLVLPKGASTTMALWNLHAHAHDAATHSPLLVPNSPTKRCGKTTVLRLLNMLVPKPLPSANVTAATIFRAIERWHPTLLIDEGDTFLREKEELRGVVNSGHERSQAHVLRCVGDDLIPAQFSTWAPKAIALIGRLHPTLEDRSIVIELRRKMATERVERLPKDIDAFSELRRKCARWATDNMRALRAAEPTMPKQLHDRAQDNWHQLLAIADLCGGEWPECARSAAIKLSAVDDDETYAIMLLQDLRQLFDTDDRNFSSKEIATFLSELEDRPWPEFSHGKPITPRGIAKLLEPFKVYPKQVRIGRDRVNGYAPNQFTNVFARYLPQEGGGKF